MSYKPVNFTFWVNICKENMIACDPRCRFLDLERRKCWLFERALYFTKAGKPHRCELCISWEKKSTDKIMNLIVNNSVSAYKKIPVTKNLNKVIRAVKKERKKRGKKDGRTCR